MSSCEELVFALQRELKELKFNDKVLRARLKELHQINEQHKELNASLNKDLKNLQAQVNIKVMNGQWHEVKEKTDE